MTAEKQASGRVGPETRNGCLESLLVALRAAARWRSLWPRLAEGKVAPQHRQAHLAKGGCQRNKQRRFAVRSRAVGQHDAVPGWACGKVEEAADRGVSMGGVGKGLNGHIVRRPESG